MKKTACILAAGMGSRSYHFPVLHKALLPLGNKAVISHCIDDLLEMGIEKFVVALQKGEEHQLKKFIEIMHKDVLIDFQICDARNGSIIGPGKTLELCKEFLNGPFIALGCDTLGRFDLKLRGNWITTSENLDWDYSDLKGEYAFFNSKYKKIERGLSTKDILESLDNKIFTGVIGIENYKEFWEESSKWEKKDEEKPIYAGLRSQNFISNPMQKWIDTGSSESYRYARALFKEVVEPKPAQEIYIYKNKVAKFFRESDICKKIINRHKLLQPITPSISEIDQNLFSYSYIKGRLLSETRNVKFINTLLSYFEVQTNKATQKGVDFEKFYSDCNTMWFEKLRHRVDKFDKEMKTLDKIKFINGLEVGTVNEMIAAINHKKFLKNCIPCLFHGDPSPENVIFDLNQNLRLIDPRPTFGESNIIGDLYYELAKVDHALIVNGQLIRSNRYGFKVERSKEALIWIDEKKEFNIFRNKIYEFCKCKKWSTMQLSFATCMTLLSICNVHTNKNYNKFLLLAGKYMLRRVSEDLKNDQKDSQPIKI